MNSCRSTRSRAWDSPAAEVPGIAEGRLRELLEVRFGPAPRAVRAPEMAAAVEQAVRDAGYLRATVTPRTEIQHAPERTVLTLAVEAGTRARLASVNVEGEAGMSTADLLSRLDIRQGQAYERERLTERIERFLDARRKEGYYEARLSMSAALGDQDRAVTLTLTVAQGPLVRVVFPGDPVPADRREELVPVAREGSVDEDLLEDSSNRIEEYFRAQGYRDAAAPHTRERRAANW